MACLYKSCIEHYSPIQPEHTHVLARLIVEASVIIINILHYDCNFIINEQVFSCSYFALVSFSGKGRVLFQMPFVCRVLFSDVVRRWVGWGSSIMQFWFFPVVLKKNFLNKHIALQLLIQIKIWKDPVSEIASVWKKGPLP